MNFLVTIAFHYTWKKIIINQFFHLSKKDRDRQDEMADDTEPDDGPSGWMAFNTRLRKIAEAFGILMAF